MSRIIGIDPGPEQSGWAVLSSEDASVVDYALSSNSYVRFMLCSRPYDVSQVIIEFTPPYAMQARGGHAHVPREVVDTAIEIGRFVECCDRVGSDWELLHRQKIKAQLTGLANGKDGAVIDALSDRYGGTRQAAKGTKKKPGPLYGISGDVWQALAVVRAWWEINGGVWS